MSPSRDLAAADAHQPRLIVDRERAGAGDAGPAHAARDHRGVAGHAAARGEDALGGVHAVNVLGRGLDRGPGSPSRRRPPTSRRCRRRTPPCRRRRRARRAGPWRSPRAARRDRASGGATGRAPAGSTRSTASSSPISPSSAMSTAIRSAALAVRLPVRVWSIHKRAALDGELDVLHVAIMALEQVEDPGELGVRRPASSLPSTAPSPPLCSRAARVRYCGVRMPATTSSPWALIRYSP